MELNQTPMRTSKNYNINNIKVKSAFFDENNKNKPVFNQKMVKNCEFNNFSMRYKDYYENLQSDNGEEKFDFYLSEELKNQSKQNYNFSKTFNFNDSLDEPIKMSFDFNNENNILIDNITLNFRSGSNSKIILKYSSLSELLNYNNELLKINLDENSSAEIVLVYDLGQSSENYVNIESNINKNANLNLIIVDFSSKNSIFSHNSKLIGENAKFETDCLYLGFGESVVDLNLLSQIFAPSSTSKIDVVGTLSDDAKKNFKGTIDFKKGSKKSFGTEDEYCMLLSKNARSKALPMLLCTEEDVDGKHSSSVGKVDEKQLFYIMSRGLSYSEAVKLIVKTKFNKIISKIFDEELKDEILEKIDAKI